MPCFSCFFRKQSASQRRRSVQELAGMEDVIKIYSYNELRQATQDFSLANKIGEGGFGYVFKGKLKDGLVVAIKVLSSESKQGVQEFLNELKTIANVVHENLVRIYGCCVEEDYRILVYNYVENNSLAQTLLGRGHSNIQFTWRTRCNICIGVARGLAFLHYEVKPPIVHRDIKASNILLDKNLIPKISDFGLARLMPENVTHVSTRVAGTIGYLAPEYALRGQLTRRADVYSFGVLLLEIISGRSNVNTRLPDEDQFLLERTWALYERGELLQIVDTFLANDFDVKEADRFLKVGLLCTQDNPKLRPPMPAVVMMLLGEREVLQKINKPGLISDFMELKVRQQNSNTLASDSHASSSITTNISTTFTSAVDHV
ncbi:cold-responsive protein kinase 1-like [Zingiber officinale]|nr:cold-responsive protein kinase 1-like [Zingiber officinale]